MRFFPVTLVLMLFGMVTAGCDSSFRQVFPSTEIVYQANDIDKPGIGFINADGTDNQILTISTYASDPVWSSDAKIIYFRNAEGDFGNIETRAGTIFFWQEGKRVDSCNVLDVGPVYPVPETNDVVVELLDSIQQIDTKTCKPVQTFVAYQQPGPNKHGIGFSLSRDGQYILYSEAVEPPWNLKSKLASDYRMKVIDRVTGNIEDVGKGINPSLSPDGKWIAYTWIDGIYLIERNGTRRQKLIQYNAKASSNIDGPARFERMPPKPRWSPDGKWLIYHKCNSSYPKSSCNRIDDYSIYRLSIADGHEEKIVERGLNPFWR